ncbi:DUF6127 family protein [Alphaproteobacteria bacterium LSUCC0684]
MTKQNKGDQPDPMDIYPDIGDVEALIEHAARRGARNALAELGLNDTSAPQDIRDLRNLLVSWRRIRKEAYKTVVTFAIRVVLLIMFGIAVAVIYVSGVDSMK